MDWRWPIWGAITNTTDWVAQTVNNYFSQFQRLWSAGSCGVWWEAYSCFADSHLIAVSSQGNERDHLSLLSLLMRALIPFMKAPPWWSIYLPKALKYHYGGNSGFNIRSLGGTHSPCSSLWEAPWHAEEFCDHSSLQARLTVGTASTDWETKCNRSNQILGWQGPSGSA